MEVQRLSKRVWNVITEDYEFNVWMERDGVWKCGCPDYKRKRSCTHIRAVWEKERSKNATSV